MPANHDVNDLSYAGFTVEQLVKLSDERDMTVSEYLDDVAQRRELIIDSRYSGFVGDCDDNGECD